jgi:hypothetical protein
LADVNEECVIRVVEKFSLRDAVTYMNYQLLLKEVDIDAFGF